jgi:dihydrofolate reductase
MSWFAGGQYLQARLIDELHLAISPVVLGQGEHLLGGLDLRGLGYTCTKHMPRTIQQIIVGYHAASRA